MHDSSDSTRGPWLALNLFIGVLPTSLLWSRPAALCIDHVYAHQYMYHGGDGSLADIS